MNDNDDKRNRDWRELDRRRDRSQHRSEERPERSGLYSGSKAQQDFQLQRYKKQLDELFSGAPKLSAEQQEMLKKMRLAKGRDIDKIGAAYVEKFGLPADWDSLTQFLDASETALLKPAVEKLAAIVKDQPATRQTLFKQRLKLLAMTTTDKDLRRQAEALLATLP